VRIDVRKKGRDATAAAGAGEKLKIIKVSKTLLPECLKQN
jgi:hypothetical protein